MSNRRLPLIRVGDIVAADEGHYHAGLGRLLLEVVEVGLRERHTDGVWQHLRGVELRRSDRARLRQRRALVRLDTIRILTTARSGNASARRYPAAGHRADDAGRFPGRGVGAGAGGGRAEAGNGGGAGAGGGGGGLAAHRPARPGWCCGDCGEEWPCPTGRVRLLERYRGNRLALFRYLGRCLDEAAGDLPTLPPRRLYARFVGWARRPYRPFS